MVDYSDEEIGWARLLHFIAASFSAVGSLCVIVSHWKDKGRAVFPLRLAYYLSTSDFLLAISGLISAAALPSLDADLDDMNSTACFIQDLFGSLWICSYLLGSAQAESFIVNYSLFLNIHFRSCWFQVGMNEERNSLSCFIGVGVFFFKSSSILWTAAISYTVYRMLICLDTQVHRFEKYFHAMCWGVPFLFIVIFMAADMIGPVELFCYIKTEYFTTAAFCFALIVIGVCVFDVTMYVKIYKGIQDHTDNATELLIPSKMYNAYEQKVLKRIMMIVVVFFATYSWMLLYLILIVVETPFNYYLIYLDQTFMPLEGFWNSLVYGDNKRMRKRLGLPVTNRSSDD
eukprot:TRINITY_DN232_c1_g1_i2.p1 TRINITY_DN232_c1_g1~~TRINITY_DN232_c1_g1_i2.p1  ORF type:complete len:344 (-),score=55.03 TRINITY_DN232_c1_g1_i2:404-1435(-)